MQVQVWIEISDVYVRDSKETFKENTEVLDLEVELQLGLKKWRALCFGG